MIIWVDKNTDKVNISTASASSIAVIDNCTSTDTTAALSANQGRELMNLIGDIGSLVDVINRKVI